MSIDHLHCLDQRLIDLPDPLKSDAGRGLNAVKLWVPTERIGSHLIDIPTAPERKWPELIPWMLEDKVLQPVEEMHFVIAGRVDLQLQVFAVSKHDMLEWIRIAENTGSTPVAMAPDFMALPNETGILSIGWREGMLLVRESNSIGFSAHPDIGWPLVDSIIESSQTEPRLNISIPDVNMIPAHLRIDSNINNSEIDWQFSQFPSVNLMSGDFRPKSKAKMWSFWWPVAASIIFMIGLFITHLQTSISSLQDQIEVRKRVHLTNYSQIFPGPKPKVNVLRAEVETKVNHLFKQKRSLQAPSMKAIISLDPLMTACKCDLVSLSVDGEGLELKVSNGEKLTSKALNIPGYQTSLKQIKSSEEEVLVLSMLPVSGKVK
jgi:type II secretion system protein L